MDFSLHSRKLAQILFCAAIFVLPFQIYTIIGQPALHLSGQLNQFQNETIYLSDILIILSALAFFPFKKHIRLGSKPILIGLLILSGLLFWKSSFSAPWLIFRIITFGLLYLLILNKIIKGKVLIKTLLLSATIQAIIATTQFITQGGLGLGLLGEPDLQSSEIAKINVGDNKVIRGYGTMPHPNILAGFLTIAIICSAYLKKYLPLTILCLIGLIFTFSRSAALALLVVTLIYLIFNLKNSLKYIKKYAIVIVLLVVIAAVTGNAFASHLFSTYEIEERLAQFGPTIEMIEENPLGVGWQNYTLEIQNYESEKLAPWEYQPVHNIYLLAASELTRLGLVAMAFILLWSLRLSGEKHFKYAIAAVMIVGLFDHYFYTLYQGQVMMVILLSVVNKND